MSENKKDLSGIILPEGKMLVELLPNYFTKHQEGTLDKTIRENQNFHVGIIRAQDKLFQKTTGHIIYFHKNICPVLNFKDRGEYHLVGKGEWFSILPETIE